MKLVKADRGDLYNRGYVNTNNYELLNEFIRSGLDCAEVTNYPQSTVNSCVTSLSNSIKRFHISGVRVARRKEKVFLIKK
nr:MAG TPA: hypothetical protein [Caudoviricetes sp.]